MVISKRAYCARVLVAVLVCLGISVLDIQASQVMHKQKTGIEYATNSLQDLRERLHTWSKTESGKVFVRHCEQAYRAGRIGGDILRALWVRGSRWLESGYIY